MNKRRLTLDPNTAWGGNRLDKASLRAAWSDEEIAVIKSIYDDLLESGGAKQLTEAAALTSLSKKVLHSFASAPSLIRSYTDDYPYRFELLYSMIPRIAPFFYGDISRIVGEFELESTLSSKGIIRKCRAKAPLQNRAKEPSQKFPPAISE
jgi:hypothetical protein